MNHHHPGYFVDLQAKSLLQSSSLLYDHFLLNHQHQQDVIDVLHLPETIISMLVCLMFVNFSTFVGGGGGRDLYLGR
jgi:hypothetical protein